MTSKPGSHALAELLDAAAVRVALRSGRKEEVIEELCDLLYGAGLLQNRAEALEAVQARERLGSTGCGSGVAVPHARLPGLERPAVALGLSRQGVDFGSVDGQKCRIFFLILGPQDAPEAYLKLLSQVAKIIKEDEFRTALLAAKDPEEAVALLKAAAS